VATRLGNKTPLAPWVPQYRCEVCCVALSPHWTGYWTLSAQINLPLTIINNM
jgi:hypothetical protein